LKKEADMVIRRVLGVLITGIVFGACGGGGGGGGGGGTGPTVLQRIDISGIPASWTVGQAVPLTATATFSNGTTQNITATATWNSSNIGVATVAAGVVTVITSGSTTITASSQGITSGSVTVVTLQANPGGPYTAIHDANVTFDGLGSTVTGATITRYDWNCGQGTALVPNCDQNNPRPTFNYRKCGSPPAVLNRPACLAGSTNVAEYTVTLRVTDSLDRTHTATTTVRVTNFY
jgi:hypothetical protein